jgi:hypothetical protein
MNLTQCFCVSRFFGDKFLAPSERFIYEKKEDNVYVLTIKKVLKDEAGMCTVKAKNPLGEMSASSRLKVTRELLVVVSLLLKSCNPVTAVKPPKITKPLEDKVAPEEGTVKMEVRVTGFPTPTFTWFRNEEEITESENCTFEYIKKDNAYIMTLTGDLRGKDGKVKIVAKNNGGEASCEAQLTIKGRAPTFVEKPMKCTILEGGTAMFRCRVDGNPEPKVEWSKGKWRKMENNSKTRVFFDEETAQYVLEMDEVKTKDAGTYTVTISNEYGSDTCSVTLICTDKEEEVQDWKAALKKAYVLVLFSNQCLILLSLTELSKRRLLKKKMWTGENSR